uniref:Transcription factor 24 n=1 Tax=Chelydra serpentina TaxID=8475 RepID=A0A8C3XN65_CHESE
TGPCPPGNSCLEPDSLSPPASGSDSCSSSSAGQRVGATAGRPAAANAARERSRVQTLRHAFLELQRTLPSVPPDTKLSKLDVLLLATTYIAHLTRSLQDEEELPGEGLGTLRGDGYLHPVKVRQLRNSQNLFLPLTSMGFGSGFKIQEPKLSSIVKAGTTE